MHLTGLCCHFLKVLPPDYMQAAKGTSMRWGWGREDDGPIHKPELTLNFTAHAFSLFAFQRYIRPCCEIASFLQWHFIFLFANCVLCRPSEDQWASKWSSFFFKKLQLRFCIHEGNVYKLISALVPGHLIGPHSPDFFLSTGRMCWTDCKQREEMKACLAP